MGYQPRYLEELHLLFRKCSESAKERSMRQLPPPVPVAVLLVVTWTTGAWAQQPAGDAADLAAKFVPQLTNSIVNKYSGRAPRVAVFAIGDANGDVTPSISETSTTLQGELIFQLQNASQ